MLEAGWLSIQGESLTFPNFDRHCSQTAKDRANTNRRVARHRGNCNAPSVANETVQPFQKPLPEQRREDSNTPLPPKGGKKGPLVLRALAIFRRQPDTDLTAPERPPEVAFEIGDGLVAAGSQQAVNGGQLNNTNVALANETTARTDGDLALTARIEAEIAAREAGDVAIRNQVVASEARTVKVAHQSGALAMAVAGMSGAAPTGNGATAVSMGVGTFGGETAIAVGVSHAVNDAVRIFGSVTKVSGGDTGAAIGGSYSF
jgi:autotransporter adhesin